MARSSGTRLSGADSTRLLDFGAELMSPCTVAQVRERSAQMAKDLVRSDSAAWSEIDVDAGEIAMIMVPVGPSAQRHLQVVQSALATLTQQHPILLHFRETGDGRPCAISDFLTREQFHASDVHRLVYSPLGIEDQLAVCLPDPSILVGVTLNRPERGFAARDRLVLNLLRPLMLRGYQSARAREQAALVLRGLQQAVEHEGTAGVVLLDRAGSVAHRTPGAVELLHRWFAPEPAGQLPQRIASWLMTDVDLLVVPGVRRDLRLRRLADGDASTVILMNEHATRPSVTDTLRSLGLTPRECEVTGLLVTGATNAQIAAALGIGVRTVEKHVQRATDKLGVPNRTAIAGLLNRIR